MKITYTANDGKTFESEGECLRHEQFLASKFTLLCETLLKTLTESRDETLVTIRDYTERYGEESELTKVNEFYLVNLEDAFGPLQFVTDELPDIFRRDIGRLHQLTAVLYTLRRGMTEIGDEEGLGKSSRKMLEWYQRQQDSL